MKLFTKRPQRNRRWLMLGGAIVLGIVATGLSHKMPHDQRVQFAAQVRAAHRMISVLIARQELARSAQTQPAVAAMPAVDAAMCLWSCEFPVPVANVALVTMRWDLPRARSLHRIRIA
jgi:hypothetical protein